MKAPLRPVLLLTALLVAGSGCERRAEPAEQSSRAGPGAAMTDAEERGIAPEAEAGAAGGSARAAKNEDGQESP